MKLLGYPAALITLLPSVTLAQQWQVDTVIDAMTDEVKISARVWNNAGYRFRLYRVGERVWALFRLPESSIEILSAERALVYRIDKRDPVDLQPSLDMRDLGLDLPPMYEAEPQWVNFRIWHGNADEGVSQPLLDLIAGERVVFRYYLFTGGYKETELSLDGAAQAITEALSLEIDPEVQERARALMAAFKGASDECDKEEDADRRMSCSVRVAECIASANRDIRVFEKCVEKL